MTDKKINVITYKRKSSKEDVDRDEPLARQNQLIERAREWRGEMDREQIVAELYDQNLSGSTDKRPGLQKLILMAKKNEFDRCYIGITSRLFRDLPNGPEILYSLRDVLGKEIIFGDVLVPQSDPYYKRYESQRFLDAQTASIDGSIGAKTGQKQLFDDGFKVGGRARYGYKLKKVARGRDRKGGIKYNSLIVPNEPAFVIANEILTIYSKGKLGVRAIANDLNRRSIPSPSAWDSWGHALFKCSQCKYVEVEAQKDEEEDQNQRCSLCNQSLLPPSCQPWNKTQILALVNEVEWTYSGHYRANYCNTRIKHGEMAGRYKGGHWEGEDYRGQKDKPVNEWRIRHNNHQAAITPEICARVVERRNQNKQSTPGGRRRKTAPFTLLCAECGSLYSRRGGGLLGCSGRERKLTDCTNRGIREATIYHFVIQSVIKYFGLLSDPEALLRRIKKLQSEKKKTLPLELRRAKIALNKNKFTARMNLEAYLDERFSKENYERAIEINKKDRGLLREKVSRLSYQSLRDSTLFNTGDIFEKLYTGEGLRAPDAIPILTPHIKKLIAYVTLHPLDSKHKKRAVGISYNPIISKALKLSVPKETSTLLTVPLLSQTLPVNPENLLADPDLLLELFYA